ncbi:class I SAM-dependent RNA methyltransferase [uncultured Sphingomonas sp.]|uniref:class I SAM-dependent RNA methyltransferase n=1 Tax=uncultured Sphingomonas sp. TaxID=158754 RepID=UPI0035CB44D1
MSDLIVRVAARGEGVTAGGRHAALAAPGDTLNRDGSVTPGPHRQAPPCRHFPTCGGCQLQHLDEASYARFVTDRVIGGLGGQRLDAPVRAALVSPPRSRRRATLHADVRGGRTTIGFAMAGSHDLVDIVDCPILAPELFALVAPLRAMIPTLGPRRRVDLDLTLCDQGVDLLITGVRADGLAAAEALTAFAQAHRLARLALDGGDGPETRWAPEPATITLGGVAVPLPPGAFLQATCEGEAALVAAVRAAVTGAGTIADLFSGLGTFALSLAPAKVYAAEAARDAILALKASAARAGRMLVTDHRDLYRRPLTPTELSRFDAVVLDPPRAGAHDQVVALAAAAVPVIAYVSCNPASFARDARLLCDGGYRLDWVQPVGQFRWSTHVELAARFSRR